MLEVFTTPNGRVSVPVLGQGWALEEQSSTLATRVSARLVVPGQFALFVAEDHYAEVRCDAEGWARARLEEYSGRYEAVTCRSLEPVEVGGVRWLEASLEIIVHSRLAPLNKLERIAAVGGHRLTLSTEASAKDLRKYWLEAQRWLEETRFGAGRKEN
ncbi:MAG: hypothetical protein SFU83_22590 [Meiothermus sp.]|nr:hypothetical protein [Meiothermus sp.]